MTDDQRLRVTCACGWQTVGSEAEVVAATKAHGVEMHNMDVTRDQVLAMSAPALGAADDERPATG